MGRRTHDGLLTARKFSKLLLYHASGGNMGAKPEVVVENEKMTFSEKRGFLDSLIRIAELERKSQEDTEEESGLDLIRSKINASATDRRRRDSRRGAEDITAVSAADPSSSDPEASEDAE